MRVERESDLHRQIASVCKAQGWYFIHSRMDRRTTCSVGAPDFVVALPGARTIWVEAKTVKGNLTVAQEDTGESLLALGHVYVVVRTLDDFLKATATVLSR